MNLDISCNCCKGDLDIYTDGPQITFECLNCGRIDYRFIKSRKKHLSETVNKESKYIAA